jgi:hypothetical protein
MGDSERPDPFLVDKVEQIRVLRLIPTFSEGD